MLRMILILIASLLGASAGAVPPSRPNVLFLIADDMNCDLGCYGQREVQSPHLDRLAATGLRFDCAYVQYTVCNPSRASFLTGLRPTTTKVMDNMTPVRKVRPHVVTLPELFRKNGYESIGLGKVFHRGLSPDDAQPEKDDPQSFDRVFYGKTTAAGNQGVGRNLTHGVLPWCRWLAAEGRDSEQADAQLADEAVKILKEHREKPLFLAVGFYRPHDPFQAPKAYFDRYNRNQLTLPTTPEGYQLPNRWSIGGGSFQTAFDKFTPLEKREFLHAYYAGVSFMDAQVGRLLDALNESKLADHTIVVFLGDHGYELGLRNWWNKNTLFEKSCRTPLIIRVPGAKAQGQATASIVEFIDLYPTLAELCQLNGVPQELEGESFSQIFQDPTAKLKGGALTVLQRGATRGRSLRTEVYRYTEWDDGRNGVELYDHRRDPGEWVNLAQDPEKAETCRELSARMKQLETPRP